MLPTIESPNMRVNNISEYIYGLSLCNINMKTQLYIFVVELKKLYTKFMDKLWYTKLKQFLSHSES